MKKQESVTIGNQSVRKYNNLRNFVDGKPYDEDAYVILYKSKVEKALRPSVRQMLKIAFNKNTTHQERLMSISTLDEVFLPWLTPVQ